jgi:shikimate dehydrogenase
VNTVVLRSDGTTFGTSTDGAGFVASLLDVGSRVDGARVAVLGAGAAARAVVDALGRSGAGEIVVVNRSAERAHVAAQLASCARVGEPADVVHADIVVNATSVGMGAVSADGPTPIDTSLLRPSHVVADLVYHPLETPLLRAARSIGATAVDGLGMLAHQAALQQSLWTGIDADARVMRAAAEAELDRRRR